MKIGLLGFGTVASATVQAFSANNELIHSKLNTRVAITKIATRTISRIEEPPPGCEVTTDLWSVVNDPEIDVVIELMGGTGLAKELLSQAILHKKHVITANKALLAHHGEYLFDLADQNGVCVLFEGAVAVSIPIVKTLKESVAANRINSIAGILNGTSNYILSQMLKEGVSFDAALEQAQQKGYAEADPTLDINGGDAAHKIALLASLAFGVAIDLNAVVYKGIESIEKVDIQIAQDLGYQVKLIALAQQQEDQVSLAVQPMLVPDSSLLARVDGSMNGILLEGDLFGTAFQYGSGAGGPETASAILADLIGLAQSQYQGRYAGAGSPNLGFKRDVMKHCEYVTADNKVQPFYIRIRAAGEMDVLTKLQTVVKEGNVVIANRVLEASEDGQWTDAVVLTEPVHGSHLVRSLGSSLEQLHQIIAYPVLEK